MTKDSLPPIESRLVRTLLEGAFAVTAEIIPPLSGGAADLLDRARELKGLADGVNVADGAGASVHMSALASAAILAGDGIEPILQVTCRDRNRIALLSDLLGASALGINNLLMLHGDLPETGMFPDAQGVYEAESSDLIRWAAHMTAHGILPAGKVRMTDQGITPQSLPLATAPRFFVGGADTPVDPPADWQPDGLKKKIKAGAQFIQTQLCYDIEVVRRYMARLTDLGITEQIFILIGTSPIASVRSARWMNKNLWGVNVPETVIDRLGKAADPKAEGIALCLDFIAQLADIPGVAGAHVMAPANAAALPVVLRQVDIGSRAKASV